MNFKKISALLSIFFEPSKTTYIANHDECSQLEPSNPAGFNNIFIPSNFMNGFYESDMNEILSLASDSFDNRENRDDAEIFFEAKNMSVQELISNIKLYFDRHFFSKKDKYLPVVYRTKSTIDETIAKLYKTDFTILNRSTTSISAEDFKFSFVKILKRVILYLKLKNLNNLSILDKTQRSVQFRNIIFEFKECLVSLYKFLNENHGKIDDMSRMIDSSSKAAKASELYDQENRDSVKRKKLTSNSASSNLSKLPQNELPVLLPSEHLFTCNVPVERDRWLVKSFCRSNTGIWYFAITCSALGHFYILKVDQKNFNKDDSKYELIKEYSNITNNIESKVAFQMFCKKIIINPSGTLYVLEFNRYYVVFEILVLNSNFHLIKKFDQNSLTVHGLEELFIEDIEIYDNLLYMFCSENNSIIVTDFDFKVKHITKLNDFKFEKYTKTAKNSFKTMMDLIVTEKSLCFHFNNNLYTCKNNIKNDKNLSFETADKISGIGIENHRCCNNFERVVYVGDNSFILLPSDYNMYLISSKIISTSAPITCKSEIRAIDLEHQGGLRIPYEIAAMEDYTIYLVKGGSNTVKFA